MVKSEIRTWVWCREEGDRKGGGKGGRMCADKTEYVDNGLWLWENGL